MRPVAAVPRVRVRAMVRVEVRVRVKVRFRVKVRGRVRVRMVAAAHVGPLGGGRVVVVAYAVRHVVRPLAFVRATVGVEREPLPGAPPRLEAPLVAAAGREPQRAAPVPLVLTPVALVLVAARQARDATPRAHAACKPAVVPLAVDADVAAAAVWPQRVVELA
jgi:hypothetical protein|tara:strand:- start:198 stop:686 length:489 start_codon:yes stop_codon:yes gene_type:complete